MTNKEMIEKYLTWKKCPEIIISFILAYALYIIIHEIGHLIICELYNIPYKVLTISTVRTDVSNNSKLQIATLSLSGVIFTQIIGLLLTRIVKTVNIFTFFLEYILISDMFFYLTYSLLFPQLPYNDFYIVFSNFPNLKTPIIIIVYIWYCILFLLFLLLEIKSKEYHKKSINRKITVIESNLKII